ncbi:MAG: ornithine carbamoyltransferase [Candidatus Thermoplasmatota archaeon]|nr:ornithine carbamoyltransferase [Candidatus Thermoplasmatota archaeon]
MARKRGVDILKKDLVSLLDIKNELKEIIELAMIMKGENKDDMEINAFKGKTLVMIFEKPSLRTRVSFEVGFTQMGGTALYLSPDEIRIGKRESVHDVAKVLSRFADLIVYRAFDSENMKKLAKHADVPVINALDNIEHPCQAVADFMTMTEIKGELLGRTLAWVGDGNNVLHSLLYGAAILGMNIKAACPKGYLPDNEILEKAREIAKETGASIMLTNDPVEAVTDSDVVYADTFISMGEEAEKEQRLKAFDGFQINMELFSKAKEDATFMHCLPAHRGEEVTDEVIDCPRSVVFQEAENRMHGQKAVMVRLAGIR